MKAFYTAPNLKQSLVGAILCRRATIRGVPIYTDIADIALPKPRKEFLKKVSNIAGLNFGIAFLGKQKKRSQFQFLNKSCQLARKITPPPFLYIL